MLKHLDIFSGIGGFALGLERTGGFKTVAFCEIDPLCQKVLKKHWPDVLIYGDAREVRWRQVLTSLPAAGRAKTSASLVQEPAFMEGDQVCGVSLSVPLAHYDPSTQSLKTAQTSLLETMEDGLPPSYGTWPRSGMMRNGIVYQLPTLAPRISGTVFGYLPTPTVGGGGQSLPEGTTPTGQTPDGRKQTVCLERYLNNILNGTWELPFLPTPTGDVSTSRVTTYAQGGRPLSMAINQALLPTPTVHGDHNRKGASLSSGDGLVTALKNSGARLGRRSFLRFREWMMGLPDQWTSLDATPQEIVCSHKSPKQSEGQS